MALDFRVTAQVPGAWGSRGEKRARGAGAGDVRCGDAVEVVKDVRGEEFDAVIDPLGGKEVWDVCRKVLKTPGQVGLPLRLSVKCFLTFRIAVYDACG